MKSLLSKNRSTLSPVSDPIERIANDASKLLEVFMPGEVSYQGDIAVVAIDALPTSAHHRANRQVADGNSQGSRHVLERGEIFDADPAEVQSLILAATNRAGKPCRIPTGLIGPVFVSHPDPTENDLTHPEHGNQGFPAGTVCAVVFQRNLDAEEREVRSQD
jgi:hypothetical protein